MAKNNGQKPGKKINSSHDLFRDKNAMWNSSVSIMDEFEKIRAKRLKLQEENKARLGGKVIDTQSESD